MSPSRPSTGPVKVIRLFKTTQLYNDMEWTECAFSLITSEALLFILKEIPPFHRCRLQRGSTSGASVTWRVNQPSSTPEPKLLNMYPSELDCCTADSPAGSSGAGPFYLNGAGLIHNLMTSGAGGVTASGGDWEQTTNLPVRRLFLLSC